MSKSRQKRRAAARAQAAKPHANNGSTGPRTLEGKAISSQNAREHCLAGASFAVLPSESESDFRALVRAFEAEHQPATQTEWTLVLRLAQCHWMVQRATRLGLTALETNDNARAALMLRYQTTHERTFFQSLKALRTLQAERAAIARNEPELTIAERIACQNHRTLRNHITYSRLENPPTLLQRSNFAAPPRPLAA